MKNPYHHDSDQEKGVYTKSQNRNLNLGIKKVDINILLNKVKIDRNVEKKKNIVFITFILLCLNLSAYIIFN